MLRLQILIAKGPSMSEKSLICCNVRRISSMVVTLCLRCCAATRAASNMKHELCSLGQGEHFSSATHSERCRQICKSTFQETEKCQHVTGIRNCCSGRLNGAEIAKTECKSTKIHYLPVHIWIGMESSGVEQAIVSTD